MGYGSGGYGASAYGAGELLHQLVGTIDAVSLLSGSLSVRRPLSGTVVGQSTVIGELGKRIQLDGLLLGISQVQGTVTAIIALGGDIDGLSGIDAELLRGLEGNVPGQSALSGELNIRPKAHAAFTLFKVGTHQTTRDT